MEDSDQTSESSSYQLITVPSALLFTVQEIITNMSNATSGGAPSSSSGRPRGRRPATRVPCDACIARASQNKQENIELCDKCTAVLHRPRNRPKETPTTRRVRRQSHAIIDTALGIRTDEPSLPFSNDKQEQHALQFFIKHSAPQLAGYFDSPFWQKMVLVAARHEPSVMHAIAAIGALHEKLLSGAVNPAESQDRRARFALEQCNKSIQVSAPVTCRTLPDLKFTAPYQAQRRRAEARPPLNVDDMRALYLF